MKNWQRYLVAFGGIGLFLLLILHEGRKKTAFGDRMYQRHIEPFTEAEVYGVITEVNRTDLDPENVLFGRRSKEFSFFDLKENWEKRYETGLDEPIEVGDTIQKHSRQNWYLLFKRNGEFYRSHPIDGNPAH